MKRTIVVVFTDGAVQRYDPRALERTLNIAPGVEVSFFIQCNLMRFMRPGIRIWEEFS